MRKTVFLLLSIVFIALAGCLGISQPYPDITMYSLNLERKADQPKEEGALALKMTTFYVSPRFESKSLVYKTSDFVYETDYYNKFMVSPSSMISEQVNQWLSASPKIKYLADSRFSRHVDYTLEGDVLELYGDFRDKDKPKAVLTIELGLLDEAKSPPETVLQEIYSQEIVLDERSVSKLINAFNQGLRNIMLDFEADLDSIK